MDITHQIFEVDVLLTDNRLVAVLEEMPGTFAPAIKAGGVPGQKPCHNLGQRDRTGAKQQVRVI
jgi:hypothetical protein